MEIIRNGKWVLELSFLALFLQWDVVQTKSTTIVNEDKQPVPAPYALSPTYLQHLAKQDRKIYNAMKIYEEEMEERLSLVRKYVKDYESSTVAGTFHLNSDDDRDKVVIQHPILAFRMLSRFAKEFDAVDQHIMAGADQAVSEALLEAKGVYGGFPTLSDFEDAVHAILKMQSVYDLPSAEIANGQIPSPPGAKNIPVNLTTEQCYYIAKNAQTSRSYTLALDWFDEIRRRLKKHPEEDNYGITESFWDEDVLGVITEHNDMYNKEFENGPGSLYSEILRPGVGPPRPSTMHHDVVSKYSTTAGNTSHPKYHEILYARNIAMCNGQHIRPPKDESNLKCWLDRSPNPYWSIHPLKIELLNEFPQIIQIHDFISDPWISYLKKATYEDLWDFRAPYEVDQTAGFTWLSDEDIAGVPLSRKIELATGLKVVGPRLASRLQVAAYAFGGYMGVHSDSARHEYLDKIEKGHTGVGYSKVTFLIYLNDVEMGGFTAFPRLRFFVKPEKGSAVVWDTKEMVDGRVDGTVIHGSCPLIYGEKWIATKWVSGSDNMFRRPCGLKDEINI